MNLIEQMNVLKGLSDESLSAELQSPSGGTPPYLVMTELNRRKDMRQRYEGEKARQKARTTVLEDLVGPGTSAPPMMSPPVPSGIEAAAAMPPEPMPQRAFATGGIVDAIDYDSIAQRYLAKLDDISGGSDRARALALIAAGAGMMGGGSSNTMKNIGTGVSAGLGAYQDQLKTMDSQELEVLRGITDIGRLQSSEELQRMDYELRERALVQERELAERRLNADNTPASIREFREFEQMTPEQQESYLKLNPPSSSGNVYALQDDFRMIVENALKSLPEPIIPPTSPEEAQQLSMDRYRQANVIAYNQIKAIYGLEMAEKFRLQAGLDVGDIAVGATGGTYAPGSDPAGLGL